MTSCLGSIASSCEVGVVCGVGVACEGVRVRKCRRWEERRDLRES